MPGVNLKGDRKSFLRVNQSSHKGPSRPRITLLPTSRPHSKSCLGVPRVLSAQLFLSTKSLTQEYSPSLSWPSLHPHIPNSSPLEVQLKYYMLHTYTSHCGSTNSPSPFLHLPWHLLSFAVHFAIFLPKTAQLCEVCFQVTVLMCSSISRTLQAETPWLSLLVSQHLTKCLTERSSSNTCRVYAILIPHALEKLFRLTHLQ